MKPEPAIDVAHLMRQAEWSYRTFGPGPRTKGILEHLAKEIREVEEAPLDLDEWVDIVILGLDGAWRSGHSPRQIIDAVIRKQERNERRLWPDWRTLSEDVAIEHDRNAVEEALARPQPGYPEGTGAAFPERIPLLVEGVTTADGRHILPGAIHWRGEIPVTDYVNGESHVIGKVTDIRRDGNLITGVVDVGGTLTADTDGSVYTATVTDAGTDRDGPTFASRRPDEPLIIAVARLVAMTRSNPDAWPWPDHPQRPTL